MSGISLKAKSRKWIILAKEKSEQGHVDNQDRLTVISDVMNIRHDTPAVLSSIEMLFSFFSSITG